MGKPDVETVADRIARRLGRYLGPHTGRVAVKTFATRALGRGPETLTVDDVPAMNEALRPMLRTLLGKQRCEIVIQHILGEFRSREDHGHRDREGDAGRGCC